MDFWNDHTILFVIGLIICPRILLLYFGHIPPFSLSHIFGFIVIPRILLTGIITPIYWDANSILIIICWILAIVCDIIGIIFRIILGVKAQEIMSW